MLQYSFPPGRLLEKEIDIKSTQWHTATGYIGRQKPSSLSPHWSKAPEHNSPIGPTYRGTAVSFVQIPLHRSPIGPEPSALQSHWFKDEITRHLTPNLSVIDYLCKILLQSQ